jgi:hypothetical protein
VGADGPDSGVGRSAPCADGPVFLAGLSTILAGCCTSIVLFSIFVAVCFCSMVFGLHFFCGGRYCVCVIEYLFCLLLLALICS